MDLQWKISENRLLRYNGKAYVSNNAAIKAEILYINHDNLKGIYYRYKHTYNTISYHYLWYGIQGNVREYIKTYNLC